MDILLKQRMVGAVVLISLAIIFLPMLFTSKNEQEQKFDSSIPAEPVYEIKSPQVSVPLPLPAPVLEKVPLREPVINETPVQEASTAQPPLPTPPQVSDSKEIIQKQQPQQSPEKETQPSQMTKLQPKPQPKPEPPAAVAQRITAPPPDIKPSKVTGWVVQVGSFSRKANANKLRDKLRKMGMACFVLTAVRNDKTVYRVRVGPEITREDAEKAKAAIKKKTKLNGLVMKYP